MKEINRHFVRKSIVLALVLFIAVILSYRTSCAEKAFWIEQLNAPAIDINVELVQKIIQGYDGFTYAFNFFFSGNYYSIYAFILTAGTTIISGITAANDRYNGRGNIVIIRTGIEKYVNNLLVKQAVYAFTIPIIMCFLVIFVSLCLFSVSDGGSYVYFGTNTSQAILVMLLLGHSTLLGVYLCEVLWIETLLSCYISNPYIMATIPFFLFYGLNFALPVISKIKFDSVAAFLELIRPEVFLLSVYTSTVTDGTVLTRLLHFVTLPIIYMGAILLLRREYIRRMCSAYC